MNTPNNKSTDNHEVWITGIGIVSSIGEGPQAHWQALTGIPAPNLDTTTYPPYTIHPLIDPDWSTQIGRRDMRQMDQWQRIGVYSSGLALDDAGLKDDIDACSDMDMIVAAGGGERDFEADTGILEDATAADAGDRVSLLNERLSNDLRPTLFLSQLSNLLAGNISIVHKVTGSSRTFMGEEGSGISAIQSAVSRIRSGQSSRVLVGAANSSERYDLILAYELGQFLNQKPHKPISERSQSEDGLCLGSGGVFLVLESRQSAEARGKKAYASLDPVLASQTRRQPGQAAEALSDLIAASGADKEPGLAVMSGASGIKNTTREELGVFSSTLPNAPLRAFASLFGHTNEVQFPLGIALAALSLSNNEFYPPFETSEKPANGTISSVLVSALGNWRAEGVGLVRRIGK